MSMLTKAQIDCLDTVTLGRMTTVGRHGPPTTRGWPSPTTLREDTIDLGGFDEEMTNLPAQEPGRRFVEAREVFEEVALADHFEEFLTLPAMRFID
jgi:hypothetical protein